MSSFIIISTVRQTFNILHMVAFLYLSMKLHRHKNWPRLLDSSTIYYLHFVLSSVDITDRSKIRRKIPDSLNRGEEVPDLSPWPQHDRVK